MTFKRYGLPLLIILLIGISMSVLSSLLTGGLGIAVLKILRCCLLFLFGLSLDLKKHRRNQSWLKKLIIAFFLIFFLIWDLGYVMLPELKQVFNFLGIYGYIIYLIYIYCGYAFFD